MRWLEAAPDRYEAGMRLLTAGRVTALHEAVAEAAAPAPGAAVLEVGCGTGAVTRRLVARGARVTALDQNPEMLERAKTAVVERAKTAVVERAKTAIAEQAQAGLPEQAQQAADVRWLERSAPEIDALAEGGFDAVVFSLSLSEMAREERRYVLAQARRRLGADGRVVAADEVRAANPFARVLQAITRAPQALVGWLLVGSVSRPIPDLAAELTAAGLVVRAERRWLLGTLGLWVAEPAP
jgi:ubiquinone/menaquinone biosynthesis C-methylase UbiE